MCAGSGGWNGMEFGRSLDSGSGASDGMLSWYIDSLSSFILYINDQFLGYSW